MFRTALKSLLGRKVRLLMSTFAIVLGVAFVCGSLIFSDTLSRSFTALFASTVGDVVVRPEGGSSVDGAPSTRTIPAAAVDELAEVEGAARADGNVTAFGVYVVTAENKVIGGQGAPGIGANWTDAPAGHGIEGFSILEGRKPDGSDEVVLDEATAEAAGYDVGDTVTVITAAQQAVLRPTLVGVAGFADGGSLNGASVSVFDTATSQELFLGGEDAYNDIWVSAADGVTQEELKASVETVLGDDLEAVTGDEAAEEAGSALQEAVGFLERFLLIFAGISLVVGAFLIVNTFSILVAQRSRELALLRAVGASKRQVMGSVVVEALVLGLLGSTVGLVLGWGLAGLLKVLFAGFGLDLSGQSLVFAPRTVLAAYAVGVVVTVLAAVFPAWRTGRIAPVQALRDDIAMPHSSLVVRMVVGSVMLLVGAGTLAAGLFSDVGGAGWYVGAGVLLVLLGTASVSPVLSKPFLGAAAAAYRRLFGSVGTLAGQNSLRNPRRTTATASALMIGLALACTMAILGDSAKASVDKSIADNFVGDYVVSNTFGQGFSASIGEEMARVPGVESVVRQRFGLAELDGEPQGVAAADPATLDSALRLELTQGRLDELVDGTALVEDEYAAESGTEVGDTVVLSVPTGEQRLRVVGEFASNPIVTFPLLTTIPTLLDWGFQDQDNYLVLNVAEQSPELQERLEQVVADLPIVTVKDQAAFAAEQRAPIDQLVLMIFALLALALLIAVLGIVNTLALSVIERTREVGLLRAIGLSRRQLRRMIALESVVIAVLGALLGVVLGIGFGVALMYALREEGLEVISVPVTQLAAFVAVSILVGVLAAFFPARRAARLDVLRAIATE